MGNRKPAVQSLLKNAKRKEQAGKMAAADKLANKAGANAGRSGKALPKKAGKSDIPHGILSAAEAAYFEAKLAESNKRSKRKKI